jgi:minor extracellular serine protease Vpr
MRRARWTWALAAAAGLSVVAAMSGAAATGDGSTQSLTRFAKIDPALLESVGAHGAFVPASLSNRLVSAVLELAGASVAVQDANARKHGQSLTPADKGAIRKQIQGQQNALHGRLATAGAKVVGQMQDAYNGIHVVVPQKNLTQLASLPGVIALHAVQTFTVANVNGVPFVGAPQAWQSFGVTGAGVKVGIIDTGIDYTHADFGGPGTVAAWNAAKATSTATASPSLFGPAAPKVKGGFDFSGDAYNADNPASVPAPDPNPLDCNSHGTHTAGTLAGFGVLGSGATFRGAYKSTTISSHSWNVGPGVAPRADLYVYRVFGCAGSSNVVDLAINQAVLDGVDVISMSLGSDFGGTDDPTSVAAQNAFDDGIAVVASAGNAGPSAYMVGSPSTSNGVLSVAAMDGSVPTYPGATLALTNIGGTTGSVQAINANDAPLPGGSFRVKVLRNADGSISLGCNKTEYAGTAGMIVVTVRGTCARVARAVFGDESGDAAVVMINNSPGFPPFEGQITSNPDTGEQHTVTIPFLGVDPVDTAKLTAADGGSVTLTATTVANTNYKFAASFSSGGPRNPDSAPKPDVIAPGVSVTSAGMGTGTGSLVDSGTSMACPMTAGVAALVKQRHPSWNGAMIKAAIMNTADPSLNLGYNSRLAGTGVVQAQKAVNSSVLATTGDQLDAIKFGYVPGSGNYAANKAFTLTNNSSSRAHYDLSVVRNGTTLWGAGITVSPATVSIAAGRTLTVQVSLSMSAAAFAALPSDDTGVLGPGNLITVRGNIVATPHAGDTTNHQTLRVPFMLVPRGLSNVAAGTPSNFTRAPHTTPYTASLPLTNNGIHTGTADLYTWGITDSRESGQPMDVRDVGVQILPGAALGGAATDRSLVFLINTWGQATNQSVNEYDILIDTNGNGKPDFVVVGADLGAVLTGVANGQFASFTIDAKTGALIDAFFADAPMNGSTIELPALASELGRAQKGGARAQQLSYTVQAFSVVPGTFIDTTGSAKINPFSPAVSSGDFATLAPGSSASFTLTFDKEQQKRTPALGWLVASVDDANGAPQAAEVLAPAHVR